MPATTSMSLERDTAQPQWKGGLLETDVVVIGAGLSGLEAATVLTEHGVSCLVLEARDRVGGKIHSKPVTSGQSASEAGAAWFNPETQPHLYKLIQDLGLDTIEQYRHGSDVVSRSSGAVESTSSDGAFQLVDNGALGLVMQEVSTRAANVDIYNIRDGNADFEDVALSEWAKKYGLREGTDEWTFFAFFTESLLGVEPSEVSALYFLDYIKSGMGIESLGSDGPHGAQFMRTRQGNQAILNRMASRLPEGGLQLSTPVRCIDQFSKGDCVVTAYGDRKFKAQKVILSLPTPLYRSITFTPKLPVEKAEYAESTFLGDYSKLTLIYAEPWWRTLGLTGSFTELYGPLCLSRDTSSEQDDQYSITCFIVGERARKWAKLSQTKRHDAILDSLARLAGEEGATFVRRYIDVRETIWMTQTWSHGGPCPVPGPGTWQRLGDALREPFDNIHFVGTETAFMWKGYMEGALTSGDRGASEVIAALSRKESV